MESPSNAGGTGAPLYVGTGLERAIEEFKQICKFKQICNVPNEIQRLIDTAEFIGAVLKDAQEKQLSSYTAGHWLRKGKEVLLDAEDLLDGLTTDAAVQQMMGADTEEKIREINDRLDELAAQIAMLSIKIPTVEDGRSKLSSLRQTSSLPPTETVIGRDREKEEIISKLFLPSTEVAESSSGNRGFSVLPIVGMGGVGKTTLAQLVFNDLNVKKHFDLMMWVCVSNDFDTRRLTKEIIEAALKKEYQIGINWDTMQQTLRQEVEGKTFLLVLDDVGEAKPSKPFEWEELCKPLNFGKKGSKVLVTTRSRAAVDKIQGRMDPVLLGGLSNDDVWSLLRRRAFKGVTDNAEYVTVSAEHLLDHLEDIGRQIAERLKGSPLAARTIGSLLNAELDVQYWHSPGK